MAIRLRRSAGTARLSRPLPPGLQVGVLPGIVGQKEIAYPSVTSNMLKLLRRDGISADRLADAPEVKLMANELWFPFFLSLMSGVSAQLIAYGIIGLLEREPKDSLVHARLGRVEDDRTTYEWIELEGSRTDVVEAVKEFLDVDR